MLFYSFTSYAYYVVEDWGEGTPLTGMKRMAQIAHRHGIPVTWHVNGASSFLCREMLTRWHEEYGDDVTLHYDACVKPADPKIICATREFILKSSYREVKEFIEKEKEIIRKNLSWAEVSIAAGCYKSDALVAVLEDLDFDGLYSYCWGQGPVADGSAVDGTSDRGCPFNFFYASHNSYKIPADYPGKVVGIEHTMRDLTNTFHTKNPCVFSTDPVDVYQSKICNGREISYWKNVFDEYLRNAEWNDFLPFIHQQEAHEMQYAGENLSPDDFRWADHSKEYSGLKKIIENTSEMMDEFFGYVNAKKVKTVPLPKLVKEYKKNHTGTTPFYMLFRWIPTKPVTWYVPPVPEKSGPFPETFFYFDSGCQLTIPEGTNTPAELLDYAGQSKADLSKAYPEEKEIPEIGLEKEQNEEHTLFYGIIDSTKNLAYGFVLWEDFSQSFVDETSPNVLSTKILSGKMLFVRLNLKKGKNEVRVRLKNNILNIGEDVGGKDV